MKVQESSNTLKSLHEQKENQFSWSLMSERKVEQHEVGAGCRRDHPGIYRIREGLCSLF